MSALKKTKSGMRSNNPTQKSEFKHLPLEVWTQIFATLPVKTLVRFRCVCKSWCSIIDNPNFIYMHLQLCNSNSDNNAKLLFALEGLGYRGIRGCLLTIRSVDTLKEISLICMKSRTYNIYGTCNGLLLMRHSIGNKEELRLWNPSIRKSLRIPPCPLAQSLLGDPMYVFGFASSAKDYKLIAFRIEGSQGSESPEMCVAVYTLSDQQWTVRNNELNIGCCYANRILWSYFVPKSVLFFQGAVHWFGKEPGSASSHMRESTHLVSLDFDLEKFTFLELPYALVDGRLAFRYLIHLGESLAIFSISSVSASIWMLEQGCGKGAWNLWFSRPSSEDGYKIFTQSSKVFYTESDDGKCIICGKKSYNIASGQVRELNKAMGHCEDWADYSESLGLCKGYGARDLTSFQE